MNCFFSFSELFHNFSKKIIILVNCFFSFSELFHNFSKKIIILVNCFLILINRFLILVNGSLVCNKSREQTPTMCPWLTKTRKQMIVLILVQCFLVSDWRRTLLWFWACLSCICLCFRLWGSGSLWRATPAMWRSAQTYTQWWRWRQRSSDSGGSVEMLDVGTQAVR